MTILNGSSFLAIKMELGTLFSVTSFTSAVTGVCLGYFLGLLFNRKPDKTEVKNLEIKDVTPETISNEKPTCSLALVVNSSLKMGKGKVAAQCGHAILSVLKKARKNSKEIADKWMEEGQDILLVSVKSDEDFDNLTQMAAMESVNHYIVADAGRTQIKSGSLTVMALGPSHCDKINSIVGQLPLYL